MYVLCLAVWASSPPPLQDRKLNFVVSQTMWKELPPKKPVGEAESGTQSSLLCLLRCCSKAFNPRGSTIWPLLGPAVQFSGTLVPASYSPPQPLSLPLVLVLLYLLPTTIFFSVVASLVLRADINCSRALRTCTFSCWHVSLHPLSWGWRRGFQLFLPVMKPCYAML